MPLVLRAGAWAVICLSLIAIGVWTASQFSAFHVQDDAYMFVRYADNLLQHGVVAWDPAGSPTYGATSLSYLALVAAARSVLPDQAALAVALPSFVCGILAIALMLVLAARLSGARRGDQLFLVALVMALLGFSAEGIAAHLTNGMDTSLAVLMNAALIALWAAWWRAPSRGQAVVLGLVGGLAYGARPDLGLFACAVPGVIALLAAGEPRRGALIALGVSAACIGLHLAVCAAYFGTPVPLSFYVKSWHDGYGPAFRARWDPMTKKQLSNFLLQYSVCFALIGLDLATRARRCMRPENALRAAVMTATMLHMAYYSVGALQVIGFHQRFYYPVLPALIWLSACAAVELARFVDARAPRSKPIVSLASLALLLALPLLGLRRGLWDFLRERRDQNLFAFDLLDRYRRQSSDFWLGLDRLAALPDDLVIATTEVGHPAVLLPNKVIVDLAGLNETEFGMRGFSAERLFRVYRPDFIYMPHPDYTEMSAAIHAHPTFVAEYESFGPEELGTRMGVALRKTSPYHPRLAEVVAASRLAQD